MSERYIKVFSGDPNLYTENAPVVIQASALLKDTETGKMIAQLKFQNISGKVISYVKATITQLDAVSNPLGDAMAFEYLDLSAADKDDFGSKKPLPLPNASTRAFRVGVSTVGFADGSVWTGDNTDWKAEAEGSAVSKAVEVEATYKKALALSKSKSIEDVKKAKEIFESIQADKDVAMEISLCDRQIANSNKKKKNAKLSIFLASGVVLLALLGFFVAYPLISYWSGDYSIYVKMYNVKDLAIRDGDTRIDPKEFYDCKILESVTIPGSVASIERWAFYGCENLKNVTIENGVTRIEEAAFRCCYSLESITIPDSITSIGTLAFWNCGNLKNVTIANGVTEIGVEAFYGCDSLEDVKIPGSVSSIGKAAFADCNQLKNATIENGVTKIEDSAFQNCESLESVTIPQSVSVIEDEAFSECGSLISIHYDGTIKQWNAITKGSNWDNWTGNYTIYCTDGEISK